MEKLKVILIFAFTFAAIGCGNAPSGTSSNAAASTPEAAKTVESPVDELARGRASFNLNCAACHKENGTGGKITIEGKTLNVDDLTSDKIKKFSDDKITGYIYNGVEDEGMPAFKNKLSEAEIREIVDYVRRGIQKVDAPSVR